MLLILPVHHQGLPARSVLKMIHRIIFRAYLTPSRGFNQRFLNAPLQTSLPYLLIKNIPFPPERGEGMRIFGEKSVQKILQDRSVDDHQIYLSARVGGPVGDDDDEGPVFSAQAFEQRAAAVA